MIAGPLRPGRQGVGASLPKASRASRPIRSRHCGHELALPFCYGSAELACDGGGVELLLGARYRHLAEPSEKGRPRGRAKHSEFGNPAVRMGLFLRLSYAGRNVISGDINPECSSLCHTTNQGDIFPKGF